jgi:glycosyltransferase involved in cell wall biosynthesis
MILEGVIVCVNYSDFLAHTLPYNKTMFNKLVVVTDTKDTATKKLCEYHHVECVQTDVFYDNGDTFNKGKAINVGLSKLTMSDWVVQLDADIYLPPLTRQILDRIELDSKTIYGIDRLMCPDYKSWIEFIENPKPIQEAYIYIHPTAFPVGVRIAEYMSKGYEPIGYFQMWNPKATGIFTYPDKHGKADRTDVLHAKQFTRLKRQLIPELLCIHLESEGLTIGNMGKNWNGRKTSWFGIESVLFNNKGYSLSWWIIFWNWLISLGICKKVKRLKRLKSKTINK